MTVAGLILAGGAGERMRRSGGPDAPKPLACVRGASLLERNMCSLFGAGVRAIWVACREADRETRDEVGRLADLVHPCGVSVQPLVEASPLGTIGAAGLLRDRAHALLSVNADNLTALDLGAMIERHVDSGADLTLAAHDHAWQLPYGQLFTDGDRVLGYREKPLQTTQVCSAVCVLGPAALALLDGPAGLPDLTRRLLERGRSVRAFHHHAAWIDINDAGDLARAEQLLASASDALELWSRAPEHEVVGAVLCDGPRILLERRTRGGRSLWDTPGGKLEPGEPAAAALARELDEELGLRVIAAGPQLARFDAIDEDGRVLRHHVFALRTRAGDAWPREGQGLEWFERAALPADRARVVARSLASMQEAAGEAVAGVPPPRGAP
jgi:NDP-sugar pyrophosphorylase family protein